MINFLFVLILFFHLLLNAQELTFLTHHIGPVPTSVGHAYVAGSKTDQSLYFNPAALSTLAKKQVSIYQFKIFDTQFLGSQFVFPRLFYEISLGLSYRLTSIGDLKESIFNDQQQLVYTGETFSYSANLLTIGWSKNIYPSLFLGTSHVFLKENLSDESSTGMIHQIGLFFTKSDYFDMGLTINQLFSYYHWSDGKKYSLSPIINLGFASKKLPFVSIYSDLIMVGLLTRPTLNLGIQFDYFKHYLLRCGISNLFQKKRYHIGVGLLPTPFELNLSYTALPEETQSQILKLSLRYSY